MNTEAQKQNDSTKENTNGSDSAEAARYALSQLAQKFYQCKDGSLVKNPLDCTKFGHLPNVEITS